MLLARTSQLTVASMLVFLFPMTSLATSPPGDPEAVNIERISSLDELKHVLDVMHTRLGGVEESHQRAFELQKTVATQSGECISRIVDLSQKADLSKDNEKEAFKAVFMRNGALLRRMVSYNQAWMDDMLEKGLIVSRTRMPFLPHRNGWSPSTCWESPATGSAGTTTLRPFYIGRTRRRAETFWMKLYQLLPAPCRISRRRMCSFAAAGARGK